MVIRTLTSPDRKRWTVGTGGGITVRSDVEEEYDETVLKAQRLLAALEAVDDDGSGGVAG